MWAERAWVEQRARERARAPVYGRAEAPLAFPGLNAGACRALHVNRAGRALDADRKRVLERAKQELREQFGRGED